MTVVSQPQRKHIVLVVVEKRRGGRVVFRRLNSTQAAEIIPAVCQIVPTPSTICTDANPSYNSLKATGHRHKVFNISRLPMPAHYYLPNVHSAASNLQRWMLQTINRTPDPKHMDYYLAEAAFRFNHRGAKNQGLLFYRLMEATLKHEALTQKDVVARQA
jgi:transposase-like protein